MCLAFLSYFGIGIDLFMYRLRIGNFFASFSSVQVPTRANLNQLHFLCYFILIVLLLSLIPCSLQCSGDIELNHGPSRGFSTVNSLADFQSLSLNCRGKTVIGYLNVSSSLGKCDEIWDIMQSSLVKIFDLSETGLNPSITNNSIQPPGYCTYRRDRDRHGGGVLLFVKDRILSKYRSDLEHPDLEAVWFEVQLSRLCCSVVIACVWIPLGSKSANISILDYQLEEDLVMNKNKKVVLIEDLNCGLDDVSLPCTQQLNSVL